MKIALVGDYDEAVTAHRAIPLALDIASKALSITARPTWIRSDELEPQTITGYDALWCVPFSPYQDPLAVIEAIRIAREQDIPCLGTCAGFQHALLEYARNVLGFAQAQSYEDDPDTSMPLISALACRLDDASDAINIVAGSRVAGIYRCERILEEYNCGFGINQDYVEIFSQGEMQFSGYDDEGGPRICELPQQRFFIATAFQPERSALEQQQHPLITAFLKAAL